MARTESHRRLTNDLSAEQREVGQQAVRDILELPRTRPYLAGQRNSILHPGELPATTLGSEDLRFSLVHLDVDLEASTLASLEFFYPRIVPGGTILTHDYSWVAGVRAACDRFLAHRPETEMIIKMLTSQAMLVKL